MAIKTVKRKQKCAKFRKINQGIRHNLTTKKNITIMVINLQATDQPEDAA